MKADRWQAECIGAIDEIEASEWDAIAPDYPFLRHGFLSALESSGSADAEAGWTPHHLLIRRADTLVAAAPLYLKSHSWGEFVFDFAWARAWQAHGLAYYPKLLCAIPFTPATGPRLLLRAGEDAAALNARLLETLSGIAQEQGRSGVHALFIDDTLHQAAARAGWLLRSDCQFHWHNHGYRDFEHYLEGFTSEKRKKARRERRRVAEQGIEFRTVPAAALSRTELARVHDLHAGTFARNGHLPYLNLRCFGLLAASLGEDMPVVLALRGTRIAAAAVCFRGANTLYGRYWGADDAYHSLHFETCYHQGIEYCIRHGLARFEPGTQGEHKLARGFEPTLTWSAHWIAAPQMRAAVAEFLGRERNAVSGYAAEAAQHLPFHRSPEEP